MIFDQEKVERGILVPNAIKCPRFTGSMLTFKLGRLLEKAQRVYWAEKARRKNQETMWDLPPPLIMEEDEDEQEDGFIELESHLFSSPLSSCSDENREPEFSQVEQQEPGQASEVSVKKNRSTNRSVQCQTSLSHFDDNPDETSNENTCTSDDSSSSPKGEQSEEWENLCAAVDNVLSKAKLVKPVSITTVQVQRTSALKKKEHRKRATAIRERKKSTVKPHGTSVVQVKLGGYTDPKIDYLFDVFSTLAAKSSAMPEFGIVVPLNEIIEPPLPPVSKILSVGQECIGPELLSPIAEPVSPTPLSDLPRVSRGLELNNVPSFVGSLLPSKMGIILNRAHQAFAQREKLKQMKLMEAKLPELIPISDDESPFDPSCTSSNNFSSGAIQPYEQCEFRTIISLDADEYATENCIDAADPVEIFPKQPEAVAPVEQNIQLNGLKFDPKSIERILNMVQDSGIIDEKPLSCFNNNSSINKSYNKRKSRKSKHFEVVHLDISDPSCFKSPEKIPIVTPEMPEVYMPPVELIPLPETPPTRTQNLCRFPSREFFPLPSNNL
uniref:Uncharacterized protein n=1 Tax=Ditylenchus dipsaci TaxID=166011 RepID=A0A915CM14_9BILA